jgi:hypothetical protein
MANQNHPMIKKGKKRKARMSNEKRELEWNTV